MLSRWVVIGMAGVLVLAGLAGATTRYVGSDPNYYQTIQSAIDASSDGDTVIVYPGTYNEAIKYLGKNIIVTSTYDPNEFDVDAPNTWGVVENTIIDANADSDDPNSVVSFNGTEGWDPGGLWKLTTYTCELRGFTITGGYVGVGYSEASYHPSNCGGGINGKIQNTSTYDGAIADITNCIVEGNHADGQGGGIWKIHGNITGCVIRNNEAQFYDEQAWTYYGEGGGLSDCFDAVNPSYEAQYGTRDCIIENNMALVFGGGLNHCLIVADCTIRNNNVRLPETASISGCGGGAYDCLLENCLIEYNQVEGPIFDKLYCNAGGGVGGGSHANKSINCTIRNNTVEGNGGGIGDGVCSGCTIENNYAIINGGGVYRVTCDSSNIYNNTAGECGGGAFSGTLSNCHVKGNIAVLDGGGACDATDGDYGRTISIDGCLIDHNSASRGGGVCVHNSASLYNCTVVENNNGGVRNFRKPVIYEDIVQNQYFFSYNSIYWGNKDYEYKGYVGLGDGIENNCFSSFRNYHPGIDDANNIIGIYPGFVDPAEGDYHIVPYASNEIDNTYPPIDYGTTDIHPNTYLTYSYYGICTNKDMDGNDRVRQVFGPNEIDMGAYEYDPNDPNLPEEPNIPAELNYRRYTLDEGEGTIAYDYGLVDHYNATLVNGPAWTSSGFFDGALSFDGVDDYVVVNDPNYYGISGAHARTVSLWFKTSATNRNQALIQWGSNSTGELWLVRIEPSGRLVIAAYGGGVYSSTIVTDGLWHHIAAVLDEGQTDAAQIRLYIDGVQEAYLTGPLTVNTSQTVPVHLGAWYLYSSGTLTNYFSGLMDEVQIWPTAWDANSVGDYYEASMQASVMDEETVHFTLDEGQGTALTDTGGETAQNGILSGATWVTGTSGNALSFDGTDDYAVTTDPRYRGISGAHTRTVSVWFKTSAPVWQSGGTMPATMPLVQWGRNDIIGGLWMVYLQPNRTVTVATAGGGVGTTNLYNDGLWHHVVAVLEEGETSSANIKLYVDGQLDCIQLGDAVTIDTETANVPVSIGAWYLYNNGSPYRVSYFQGLIDDVQILPTAWDADDVEDYYQGMRFVQLHDDAVAYFNCDEGSGTALSDQNGNYDAVLYNGVSWSSTSVYGNALSFDGTNDYAQISNYYGVGGTGARSVSLWFKTSATNRNQALIQWGSNSIGELWLVRIEPNDRLVVAAYDGGVYSDTFVTNDEWHHVVAVLDEGQTDSAQIRLYMDGAQEAYLTGSTTVNTSQTVPVHLGAWYLYSSSTLTNYFLGLMDEVRIYDQALTAEDVEILYGEF